MAADGRVQKAKALVLLGKNTEPEWTEFDLSVGLYGIWELKGPEKSDGSLRSTSTLFEDFRQVDLAWLTWYALNQPGGKDGFEQWMVAKFQGFEFVGEKAAADPKESRD